MTYDDGHLAVTCEPILVGAVDAAALLGVSVHHWRRLRDLSLVPAPIRLGRRQLWRVDELRSWAAAGCPSREQWEETKQTSS